MQSLKRFLSTSFGSAVAGGAVVCVVGLILIQAGVVNSDNDNSGPMIEPAALARPASNSSQGLTVHDIYQRDAQGVAFIRSTIVQKTQSVFGFPQQQSSQATGSGFLIDNDGHILTNAHVVEGAKTVTVQLGEWRRAERPGRRLRPVQRHRPSQGRQHRRRQPAATWRLIQGAGR